MTKNQILIVGALFLLVAVGITIGLVSRQGGDVVVPSGSSISEKTTDEAAKTLSDAGQNYSPDVPKNAKLTEAASQVGLSEGDGNKSGYFDVSVSDKGYSPSNITVKKGDTVTINLRAEGGDYDFFIEFLGVYVSAKAGETKSAHFKSGDVGTFIFRCRDFCPKDSVIEGVFIAKS